MKKLATVLILSAITLSGCSGEVSVGGDPTVDQAEVEREVSAQLEETVGQKPDSIKCRGRTTAVLSILTRCEMLDE